MTLTITRRAALATGAAAGATSCASAPGARLRPSSEAGFFAHGVASGDPGPTSVVLWTRISAATTKSTPVKWEIATDENFTGPMMMGEAMTGPARDFTVKAIAPNLEAGRTYFYRFIVGGETSPVGRTKTLPVGATPAARFAVVSCSNYPFGYFNVYEEISRRDDLDAVIHLGDYIYEYGPDGYGGEVGERLGRAHAPAREIVSLADYRARHAQYKSDPASQAMHARHPLIAIWDDHETTNNSWKDGAQNHQPETEGDWPTRRRAALQAYYEWMPVREPAGAPEGLFRAFSYGDLLTLAALETRLMARGRQLEYSDIVPMLRTAEDIVRFRDTVLADPTRNMMGGAQLDWLERAFRDSAAAGQPWRLLANQIIMAEVVAPNVAPFITEPELAALEREWEQARAFVEFSKLGLPSNLDAWDGYPAARERLYGRIRAAAPEGLIVLTGDTHSWWANDLASASGEPVGIELGVSSTTSPSPYRRDFLGGKGAQYALLTNQANQSVRYLSGATRGFIDLEVRRDGAEAHFRGVDAIETTSYAATPPARFAIAKTDAGVSRFAGAEGLTREETALFYS